MYSWKSVACLGVSEKGGKVWERDRVKEVVQERGREKEEKEENKERGCSQAATDCGPLSRAQHDSHVHAALTNWYPGVRVCGQFHGLSMIPTIMLPSLTGTLELAQLQDLDWFPWSVYPPTPIFLMWCPSVFWFVYTHIHPSSIQAYIHTSKHIYNH